MPSPASPCRRRLRPPAQAWLVGISAGLFWTLHARADDAFVEQVTVSANQLEEELPQELAKYGTRVDTISAEQIRDGGYADVAQALEKLAPGLFLSPKNGPFDYVDASYQGSRTGDILSIVATCIAHGRGLLSDHGVHAASTLAA